MIDPKVLEFLERVTGGAGRVPPPVDRASEGGDDGRMEARIAKLEAHVEHVRSDLADIKSDVRDARKSMRTDFLLTWGGIIALAGLIAKGFGWI